MLGAIAVIAGAVTVMATTRIEPAGAVATTPACSYFTARTGLGVGTLEDPFQIASADDLAAIDSEVGCIGLAFRQTYDIDLSSVADWDPIGGLMADNEYHGFIGTYDGDEHTISNLTVSASQSDVIHGLFYAIYGGWVRDLTIDGASVTANSGGNAGILTGYLNHYGRLATPTLIPIQNVHVSGTVVGGNGAGGVIGWSNGAAFIDCSADVTVTGQHAGGITGSDDKGIIVGSHTLGSIFGSSSAGGLVGRLPGATNGSVVDSYSSATVSGSYLAGGLVGDLSSADGVVSRSFATGTVTGSSAGGLVGGSSGAVTARITGSFAVQSPISAAAHVTTASSAIAVPVDAHTFLDSLDATTDEWSSPWVRTDRSVYPDLGSMPAPIVAERPIVSVGPASATVTTPVPDGLPSEATIALVTQTEINGYWTDSSENPRASCSIANGGASIECIDPSASYRSPYRFRVAIVDPYDGIWASPPSEAVQYTGSEPCGSLIDGVHVLTLPDHVRNIGSGGTGTGECQLGASYRLATDLDMQGWFPAIGFDPANPFSTGTFSGIFDGDGHTLSNIDVNSPSPYMREVGFFGRIQGAQVHDVRFADASLVEPVFGSSGFVAGSAIDSTIRNLVVEARILRGTYGYSVTHGGLFGTTNASTGRTTVSDIVAEVTMSSMTAASMLATSATNTDFTRILLRGSVTATTASQSIAGTIANSNFDDIVVDVVATSSSSVPSVIGSDATSSYTHVLLGDGGPSRWNGNGDSAPVGTSTVTSSAIADGSALTSAGLDLSNGTWSATADWSRCTGVLGGWPFPSSIDDGTMCATAATTTTSTSTTTTSSSTSTSTTTTSTSTTTTSTSTTTTSTSTATSTTSTTSASTATSTTIVGETSTTTTTGDGANDVPTYRAVVRIDGQRFDANVITLPDGTIRVTYAGLTIDIDGTRLLHGRRLHIAASGFGPNAVIVLTLHSDPVALGTTAADPNGSFDFDGEVPDDVPAGAHTLELAGSLADGSAVTVAVGVAVSDDASSTLPTTGGDTSAVPFAVGLLAVGAVLALVARSRSREDAVTSDR